MPGMNVSGEVCVDLATCKVETKAKFCMLGGTLDTTGQKGTSTSHVKETVEGYKDPKKFKPVAGQAVLEVTIPLDLRNDHSLLGVPARPPVPREDTVRRVPQKGVPK